MKHHLVKIFSSCILLFSILATGGFANSASLDNSEANSIVSTYLSALSQGDTITIKQVIGGEYLNKRTKQLDNPNYSSKLSKRYSLASSRIIETRATNQESYEVDVVIELNPDEVLACRFIVAMNEEGQLKIIDEQSH